MSSAEATVGTQIITEDWTVSEIVAYYPGTTAVLAEYGFHCMGCSVGGLETLAEAATMHGMSEEDLSLLLRDLNDAVLCVKESKSGSHGMRPLTLSITPDAARAVLKLGDGQEGWAGVAVEVDESGNFYLEFREEAGPEDHVFSNEEVPELRLFVSPLTLSRVGGATIDFKNGQFKLDIENKKCCIESNGCKCATRMSKAE
jgi:hydroxylamine reductase